MIIVEVKALENGAHRNQIGIFEQIPKGWAVVPDTIALPETFPFVTFKVKNNVVTSMTAGKRPDTVLAKEPTDKERIEALEKAMLTMMEGIADV